MPTFIRLTDYKDSDSKEQGFFKSENRYEASQDDFEKIPGSPIAYWVSDRVKEIFEKSEKLNDLFQSGGRIKTHNNELFVRFFWEIEKKNIPVNWKFYENGGESIKWYGNKFNIVNWCDNALNEYKSHGGLTDKKYWSKTGITWSIISTNDTSFRLKTNESEFSSGSPTIFLENSEDYFYPLSLLNTQFYKNIMKITAPTVNTSVGDVLRLPIIFPKSETTKQTIDILTGECIDISKEEWDSRETSWDFTKNELLKHKSDSKIETAYNNYCQVWSEKFYKLHANEEELNRLFIDIYELGDELTPDVALKDITILKSESIINDNNELEFKADEIMKQFISYAVGVMFGRYSLDSDGLVVANLNQDYPKDTTFEIDDDNVIPVLEDDYFSDDIASRVVHFVKVVFGQESLSANIAFVEKCLGKTIRAYMVKDFYEDHIKRYKKRPIYWMVSSPKKGFMSLIYMHRYTSDIFGRVRNAYLTEYIAKLEAHKETLTLTTQSSTASNKDKKDADKQIKNIESKLKELIAFDRDMMMSYAQNGIDIDLDDGVKVNYCKFQDILYEFDKKLCK